MALVISVAHHVNHHGTGKEENIVLPASDLHAVSVRPGEPLFGHARHGPSTTGKRVFVIEEVSFRLQVVWAGTSTVNVQWMNVKRDFFTTAASCDPR